MSQPQRKSAPPTAGARERAAERSSAEEQARYRQAASLLRQWMDTRDGEDTEVWPLVEEELQGIRTRLR